MSIIEILAGPVIGAVIGYCTNYIAVKMLFKPLNPVKLGNWTLPFTPGIIPKGKARMAKAMGEVKESLPFLKTQETKRLISVVPLLFIRPDRENFFVPVSSSDQMHSFIL